MIKNNENILIQAQKKSKKYLQRLNKYFVNQLHLEQDRSDPEFTFYWYKIDNLIADIGIDSDTGILIVLLDSKLFDKRIDLIANPHVEFLEEYEGEKLMCIEIYEESDIALVKSLAHSLVESYK